MKSDTILVLLGIIIGVCLTILYYSNFLPRNSFVINDNMIEGVDGLYVDSGFYCVVTRGRTAKEVNTTEHHEACHDLVKKDWDHFCSDKDILGVLE